MTVPGLSPAAPGARAAGRLVTLGRVTRKSPVSAAARCLSSSRNLGLWSASLAGSELSHWSSLLIGTSRASSSSRDKVDHCSGSICTAPPRKRGSCWLCLQGGVQQQPRLLPVSANGSRRNAARLGDLLDRK